jgi:tetratricopeptide (TPR) repeat protein
MNRAGVLVRAGSYDRAAAEYRRVLEQDEAHAAARVGLGISLRGMGKHAEAASEYERVLSAEPNNVAALFDLAIVEREHLQKPDQAKKHFELFLEVAPEGAAKEYAERALQDTASASTEGGS